MSGSRAYEEEEVSVQSSPVERAIAEEAIKGRIPRDVRRALRSGRPAVVVCHVAGPTWVAPVADFIRSLAPAHVVEIASEHLRRPTSATVSYVQANLEKSIPVVFVTAMGSASLPRPLAAAPDYSFSIPPLSAVSLRRVVHRVTGKRVSKVDGVVHAVTELEELALLIRPHDRPAQILARLERLAAVQLQDEVPALSELPGFGAAKEWGNALAADFRRFRNGELPWSDLYSRLLLDGEPGTGKTFYARALSKELGLPLIATSVGDWFTRHREGHLDDVLRAAGQTFDEAGARAPCVLFLDEVDGLPSREALGPRDSQWWSPVINLVLERLDGATRLPGVIVLAATNYRNRLDPALLRPGRLDSIIRLRLPTPKEVGDILRYHLGSDLPDADLTVLSEMGAGETPATIAFWVKNARAQARQAGKPLELEHLRSAIAPRQALPLDLLRRVAIHESGHAVAAHVLGAGVGPISILPGRTTSGSALFTGLGIVDLPATETTVQIMLSGRAAEEAFGSPTIGAGGSPDSDLAQATHILASAYASYGLGASLLYSCAAHEISSVLASDTSLRATVHERLVVLHAKATTLINAQKEKVERLAETLLERNWLSGPDVVKILDGTSPARQTADRRGPRRGPRGPRRGDKVRPLTPSDSAGTEVLAS